MTRRHLTIAIDANRVTCGKCGQLHWGSDGPGCYLYGPAPFVSLPLESVTNMDALRCAPCLAAEKGEATG